MPSCEDFLALVDRIKSDRHNIQVWIDGDGNTNVYFNMREDCGRNKKLRSGANLDMLLQIGQRKRHSCMPMCVVDQEGHHNSCYSGGFRYLTHMCDNPYIFFEMWWCRYKSDKGKKRGLHPYNIQSKENDNLGPTSFLTLLLLLLLLIEEEGLCLICRPIDFGDGGHAFQLCGCALATTRGVHSHRLVRHGWLGRLWCSARFVFNHFHWWTRRLWRLGRRGRSPGSSGRWLSYKRRTRWWCRLLGRLHHTHCMKKMGSWIHLRWWE